MHVQQFLHKKLEKALPGVHKTRLSTLIDVSSSLLNNTALTLTSLGRHIKGKTKVKHKIKRVDRLLANPHVNNELFDLYEALCSSVFNGFKRMEISVDWSGCCDPTRHILQASASAMGRSVVIYRELHPKEKLEKKETHDSFLENLKRLLPSSVEDVVIITDAGFLRPWFRKVQELGFDYVGRVRGGMTYSMDGSPGTWKPIKFLYEIAKNHARYIGKVKLGKTKLPFLSHVFTYKEPHKGRKKQRKKGTSTYPDQEKNIAKRQNEPWVLVTSLEGGIRVASRVKNIYKRRMQIEQNFRDDKNERWGFGLRYSRTLDIARTEILLLLAAIASYMLWLVGLIGEQKGMQNDFQANTIKTHRVISLIKLGKEMLYQNLGNFKLREFCDSIKRFKNEYVTVCIG